MYRECGAYDEGLTGMLLMIVRARENMAGKTGRDVTIRCSRAISSLECEMRGSVPV